MGLKNTGLRQSSKRRTEPPTTERKSMLNLKEAFDACDGDYIKFERIESKPSQSPDLCAFLLLDKLVPGASDIVAAAEHDEIYLGVDCEKLAAVATQDDIVYLARCGVRYEEDFDSLCMFV